VRRGGLCERYAVLGDGFLPHGRRTAGSRGLASPRQGIIVWQRSQRNDGRRVNTPGDLNTAFSARSILDVLRLVPNRSRMSLTRHGEQINLPRKSPWRRKPTSGWMMSSVVKLIVGWRHFDRSDDLLTALILVAYLHLGAGLKSLALDLDRGGDHELGPIFENQHPPGRVDVLYLAWTSAAHASGANARAATATTSVSVSNFFIAHMPPLPLLQFPHMLIREDTTFPSGETSRSG